MTRNFRLTPDTGTRAGRMLTAGRLTATVTSERTGQHVTIELVAKRKLDGWKGAPLAEATHVFITVPSPEGWGDKVGTYNPGSQRLYEADGADPARVFAALQVMAYASGQPTHPQARVLEASRCGRCGRELTDPVSIERGIGPECYGATTGSSHQSKHTGAREVSQRTPERAPQVPANAPQEPARPRTRGAARGSRADRDYAAENGRQLRAEQGAGQQMATLPGASWEDIFG
jgi:hypothetical protein